MKILAKMLDIYTKVREQGYHPLLWVVTKEAREEIVASYDLPNWSIFLTGEPQDANTPDIAFGMPFVADASVSECFLYSCDAYGMVSRTSMNEETQYLGDAWRNRINWWAHETRTVNVLVEQVIKHGNR
jgi:hypothetical protein